MGEGVGGEGGAGGEEGELRVGSRGVSGWRVDGVGEFDVLFINSIACWTRGAF